MKTAVAIRHVHFENLGSFAAVLEQEEIAVTYLEAGRESLRDRIKASPPDLLVVLGAPIGVYETEAYPFLVEEIQVIKERLEQNRPILGICLGAQLMAAALGAKVYASGIKEIGWSPIQLTPEGEKHPIASLASADTHVLHWHGDTFDLPSGATHLASTPLCKNQAFAIGSRALGLQFHAEVRGRDIESWLIGHACEIASAPGIEVNTLRNDTRRHAERLEVQGRQFFKRWLDGALGQK